jgi:DNA-binding transcriptional LysR family regulator
MKRQIDDSEVRLLRIFDAIVRHNGFSAAQAELNISAPAISRYMSELESRLGLRLCERGQRGFSLTKEGQDIHGAACMLFASLDDFRNSVTASGGKFHGEIRFGVIDNTITNPACEIGDAIREFNQTSHADVRFNIYVGGPVQLEQRVLDNRIHAAVGLFHHRIPALEYEFLYETEHAI